MEKPELFGITGELSCSKNHDDKWGRMLTKEAFSVDRRQLNEIMTAAGWRLQIPFPSSILARYSQVLILIPTECYIEGP